MRSLLPVPGCGGASRSGRLLTSIGLDDLDTLIGGGLLVGDLCLVKHPENSMFVRHLREAYAKEGSTHSHGIFHAQALQRCGGKCPIIAAGESAAAAPYIRCFSSTAEGADEDDDTFSTLLRNLGTLLSGEPFAASCGGPKNLLRVLVDDVGSMVWCAPERLVGYVARLRALLRHSYACCLLLTPFGSSKATTQVGYFSDVVLSVDEVRRGCSAVNPSFSSNDGLLRIEKLSASNRVAQCFPPSSVYGFKKKKGRICIQPLHIPPTLGDDSTPHVGCQTFLNF